MLQNLRKIPEKTCNRVHAELRLLTREVPFQSLNPEMVYVYRAACVVLIPRFTDASNLATS